MRGAMHGLADGLDPDSAYLTAEEVKQVENNTPLAAGDVGIDLTRQYYLRVIAARDDSPAAKAGIRTGDYIRAIGDTPTREMSVWEGARALRGAPGSKVSVTVIRGNAADPHVIELVRTATPTSDVSGKIAAPGVGYVRVAAIGGTTAGRLRSQIQDLTKAGAQKLMIDLRRTSGGLPEHGVDLARLFVSGGTLAMRETRDGPKETITASSGDGAITAPVVILIDAGTSAAAELFASALAGNKRADLVGEHTIGRAAIQKLVKLPDGAGLWLSTARYLTPAGTALHEKGLEPTVAVDEPDVEFGQTPPPGDPVFDKALERLTDKKAA
jgi:carboxyl-terminal processing protease